MQNANPSEERSEEQGRRISDTQRSAEHGFAPASTIERAAQRLDWTIAFGAPHHTPRGLEGNIKEQPQRGFRPIARALPLRSSRGARPSRIRKKSTFW